MNRFRKGIATSLILMLGISAFHPPVNTYAATDSSSNVTMDIDISDVQTNLSKIQSNIHDIETDVTSIDTDVPDPKEETTEPVPTLESSLSARKLKGASRTKFIHTIGPIAQKDYQKNGVLASVTIAQAILESGGGQSSLAQKANNLFGMKKNLSGNSWAGSTWTGSIYKKRTAEYTKKGKKYYITASFRKYKGINQSIGDHSAYLVGAKKGKKKRYAGLTSTKSYSKQISIIQKGGYATSSSYGKSLKTLIKKYKLTQYDVK